MKIRSTLALLTLGSLVMAGCATGPNDAEIAAAVKERLSKTKAVEVQKLEITSSGGIVRLAGTQTSPQEKQAAAAFASGVAGVKGVKNDIVVAP